MFTTESLTEKQWSTVYAMAEMLVNEETDVNELSKAIAYLRSYGHQENAGGNFFEYLRILVRNGRSIGHSGMTPEYYRSIEKACKEHLQSYQDDVEVMLQILGWVARMMRYYKSGGSIEVVSTNAATTHQTEIEPVLRCGSRRKASQELSIDDIVDATITNIKGVEVTYTIQESIKSTQKEHRKVNYLSVGQVVKVRIVEMKNGKPKKLQLLE